jgi:HD-GYP domain-containing protein (c-di-GMP phosphodiesterase class II)
MIDNQKDFINDLVKKFDKSSIEERTKDLEEILTELQKTNNRRISKVVVEAFNKAINELKEAKEQIENPIK